MDPYKLPSSPYTMPKPSTRRPKPTPKPPLEGWTELQCQAAWAALAVETASKIETISRQTPIGDFEWYNDMVGIQRSLFSAYRKCRKVDNSDIPQT
jgi:hypothetical protein